LADIERGSAGRFDPDAFTVPLWQAFECKNDGIAETVEGSAGPRISRLVPGWFVGSKPAYLGRFVEVEIAH
jgi:hypothetical protein